MDIPSAVSAYRTKALPHRYSTGGGFKFFFATMAVACVCGLMPKVKTGIPITVGLFCAAKMIGRNREQTSVDQIAGLIHDEPDRSLLRQEIAGLPRSNQLRLTQLLRTRGIVV